PARRGGQALLPGVYPTPTAEVSPGRVLSGDNDPAARLPEADAPTLVDRAELEARIRELYREVARDPAAPRHFATRRELAVRLGCPAPRLRSVPDRALASFAGVGYHLDLARLEQGERVLDLGSGSGTDAFCAASLVGESGPSWASTSPTHSSRRRGVPPSHTV